MSNLFSPAIAKDEAAQNLIREWIAALRSGHYQQAQSYLRKQYTMLPGTAYCCLGVLCDISGKGTWTDQGYVGNEEKQNPAVFELPSWLARTLYFEDVIGTLSPSAKLLTRMGATEDLQLPGEEPVGETSLVALNDHYDLNFGEIADIVEAELQLALHETPDLVGAPA